MTKIEGLTKLVQQLGNRFEKARRDRNLSVIVIYTKNYALPVHEIKRHHTVGQWKYLEEPARTKAEEIGKKIVQVTKRTGSLEMGLMAGGLLLQRESQKLVPVDTGDLKGSAETRVER